MRKVMVAAVFAVFVAGIMIPIHTGEGKSHFFQAIKDVFHYFPGDTQKATVKETPTKFEKTMKKELKYPEVKPETK